MKSHLQKRKREKEKVVTGGVILVDYPKVNARCTL